MNRLTNRKEMLLTNLKYKKIQYGKVVKEYKKAKKTASQKELEYLLIEDKSTWLGAGFTAGVVVPCFLVGTLSGISLVCTDNNPSLLGGVVIASVGITVLSSIVIPKFFNWNYSYAINQEIEKIEEDIYNCEQKQIEECSKKFIEKDFGAEK